MFADLALPKADQELIKARLTLQIYRIIKDRGLHQTEAGKNSWHPATACFGAYGDRHRGRDRLQWRDIVEACQGVALAFDNGDTVITEMLGVAIAKRVWPEGFAEWKSAAERRRVYEYRTELLKLLEPVTWTQSRRNII